MSAHREILLSVDTVKEPFPKGKPQSYVLVRCGAPRPDLTGDLADAPQIQVPIKSLFSASTTHLPLLSDLGRLDVLSAVAEKTYVTSPEVNARIADGRVAEYASGGTVNSEKVITSAPDVLMTQGTDDPAYPALRTAGIAVVANAEYLEATPLGRAEWLKVMAALTGTETQAEQVYAGIRSRYAEVARTARDAAPVQVLPGTMYQGTWYMPSGGSYVGKLLADAGGTYPFAADTSNGSLELGFESVFAKAGTAPTWLVTEQWKTTAEALKDDARYGQLSATKTGQVWSATKVIGPGGGNDFYERGVTRPDLVLGDLVAILHPDLAPKHEFAFYRPVPRP
jgi:iron complex transport system substrate-binding protein